MIVDGSDKENFNVIPDNYQSKALESWYKENNDLRYDLFHPLLGLAGEAGELLNLYKKDLFKPNFSWWNCKSCGKPHNDDCQNHVSLIWDELGDFWYYFRIICFISGIETKDVQKENYYYWDVSTLLSTIFLNCGTMLHDYDDNKIDISRPKVIWGCFYPLLGKVDCNIDKLTALNYEKLNSEVSQHGWGKAR